MADHNRQTGRTTDSLRHCYNAAVAGTHVVYVIHAMSFVNYCQRILLEFGPCQLIEKHAFVYPSGGRIDFMSGDDSDIRWKLRGTSGVLVVRDHAWWDLISGRT